MLKKNKQREMVPFAIRFSFFCDRFPIIANSKEYSIIQRREAAR